MFRRMTMKNAWRLVPFALAIWALYAFTPGCTSQQLPPQEVSAPGEIITVPNTITGNGESIGKLYINKSGDPIIDEKGLALTKYYEGLYLKAYKDGVNVWTICYGRINYPDGTKVKEGDTATNAQCEAWLLLDLDEEGYAYVKKLAMPKYTFTQDEISALVSFTYNRGPGRLRLLLGESHTKLELADNLLHYDYAGATTNHMLGLKRRRRSERALFLGQQWEAFKEWK